MWGNLPQRHRTGYKGKRGNDKITDRTPEVALIAPPPGLTTSHGSDSGQGYTPKRVQLENPVNLRKTPKGGLPPCQGAGGCGTVGTHAS